MSRKPESRGTCAYCRELITRRSISKHMQVCSKRQESLAAAEKSDRPVEFLWHLRVQDAYDSAFWLDLEMRGSASLSTLDAYLRAIWLECCGHLSKFTVGGWGGHDVGKSRKADNVFTRETILRHLYDFGTTSETDIKVVGSRQGKATTRHPIALLARNNMPEMPCSQCGKPAAYLCIECLYEGDEEGAWFLCDEHVANHPHEEYGEPIPLVNSPRLGMCGYDGPAEPPY